MDATDEAAKLQKLSMKLADRLHGVEGNPTDLFCRFIDEERWLSMSVLLMDKSLRRTSFRDAPDLPDHTGPFSRANCAYRYLLQAAEAHEDISVKRVPPRTFLRLNPKKMPAMVEQTMERLQDVKPAPVVKVDHGNRNCKGELGHVVSKKLGRPIAKEDVRYETWKTEQAVGYMASCFLWGETYTSKTPHSSKKGAEQDAAGVALEAIEGESTESTDFKGQLLRFFQGQAKEVHFDVQRVDKDSEEKMFQATVRVPSEGQSTFTGAVVSRSNFDCSAKTRAAAEQDAAKKALEALQCQEKVEEQEVQILWLPADCRELVVLKSARLKRNDLHAVAEDLLGAETVCHPLAWLGDRPKGICLYEAVVETAEARANARASALAEVEIFGDSFLMDASAHSRGAVVVDISLLRYEHLKAEKCPASRASPVRMLSQSRGMLLGHPKLPEKFQAETWLGQNPKSLLLEVARKRGYNQPHFEVYPETEENKSWRATVQICSEEESKFAEGLAFANKMDTQHDAALAMLRQLQAEDEAAGVRHHPLREGFLACLRRLDKGGAGAVQGSKVLCRYQITLAGKASDSVLLVERHEKLSCVLGSRVLHPALEDLLGGLAVGEEATAETDCRYEGIDCTMTLSVQLQELQLPETPLDIPKKVVKFDPPLSKQRQNFIVQALKGRKCSSALDLGCGDGQLLEALLSNGLERVLGVELSEKRVKACRKRLKDRAEVICADFVQVVEGVPPWMAFAEGVQAVVLCEVLEHLPDVAMPRLPAALFALQPQVVVVTSPNADFGESSDEEEAEAKPRQFRHSDHEREWSRQEFRSWAEAACDAHGYWISEFGGVGHLDGFESQGPCTQLCVFERRDEEAIADPNSEESEHRLSFVMAEQVDVEQLKAEALRSEDLGGGLWKYVHREGLGNLPAPHARVNLHYATFLGDGKRVDTSREKKRSTPFAFQLGGQQALAAWQLAAASMRPGEVAWVYSPSSFAYGERGAPPLVPGDAAVYFALELNFARAPGTVRFFGDLTAALQEAEKHMEVGRGDVKRQAFAQARQAFRRAMAAVPEKLLLGRSQEEISSFAALERAALLNQALCCLRLGEATEKAEALSHLRDALHACDSLFQRHGVGDEVAESLGARPELLAALREASLAEGGTWMAKAHFRRGMAKEKLQYLADALVDYQAALKLEPGDGMVQRHLASLKARQQKAELKPERMFAGILQRERSEREKEEAAAELAEKKRRREQRLAKSGQSEVQSG
ncbi:unnamed protein product [Effrenium voratum]|uniref:peptidylprolyl isomerase n=1 Tax=Effrenium voratum TaxID=2562239 RepID=A0AA36IK47_9DINO|nr:unnamed protein product [Effrenium voratum]CAJ1445123.1 unnamed protein product [Effrenium voratum]